MLPYPNFSTRHWLNARLVYCILERICILDFLLHRLQYLLVMIHAGKRRDTPTLSIVLRFIRKRRLCRVYNITASLPQEHAGFGSHHGVTPDHVQKRKGSRFRFRFSFSLIFI